MAFVISTPALALEAKGRLKVIVFPAAEMVKSVPVVEVARHFKLWLLVGLLAVAAVLLLAGCRTVEPVLLTPEQAASGQADLELPVGYVWENGQAVKRNAKGSR